MYRLLAAILITAFFNTSTSAVISWEQPPGISRTCIVRYYGAEYPSGFCLHDLPAGPQSIELPGIYDGRWYSPAHGDRYDLWMDGVLVGSAVLGESVVYRLYMPLAIKSAPEVERAVYLPWVGR